MHTAHLLCLLKLLLDVVLQQCALLTDGLQARSQPIYRLRDNARISTLMRPMRRERAASRLLRALRLAIVYAVLGEGTGALSVPHVLSVLVVEVQRRAHLPLQLLANLVLHHSLTVLGLHSIASSTGINGYSGW